MTYYMYPQECIPCVTGKLSAISHSILHKSRCGFGGALISVPRLKETSKNKPIVNGIACENKSEENLG
jgi:hypothetical protein